MHLLTGMYTAKVDEKGRLSLPSRLRAALSSEEVVVLPGLDGNHLMLMTPDYFENQFCVQIISTPLALMDKEKRQLMRKIISPAQYLDVDGAGRINIPQSQRDGVGIANKSECLLMGTGYAVEIWNPETFDKEDEECTESVSDLAQKIYEEEKN